MDRHLRVPKNRILYNDGLPLWVMNELEEGGNGPVRYMKISEDDFLDGVLKRMHAEGISSVLVEGGAALLEAFIKNNHWDELRIGVSLKKLGEGVKAPVWPTAAFHQTEYGDDLWHQVIR